MQAEKQYAPPLCRQFTGMRNDFSGDTLSRQFQVYKMMQPYFCALARSHEEITTRIPDVWVTDTLLQTNERTIRLRNMGVGHTPSDLVVYLPEERILFAGDLLTNGFHPNIPDGRLSDWLGILDVLETWDIGVAVPGHGEPAGKELVTVTAAYLQHILTTAQTMNRNAAPADSSPAPPPSYQEWWLDTFYSQNIRFIRNELMR